MARPRRGIRTWLALAATLVLGLALVDAAVAASLSVTRFDDPAPGACEPDDCSLREAIVAANATSDADLVALRPGSYRLGLGPLPNVVEELTIAGAGASLTEITGGVVPEDDPALAGAIANTGPRLTLIGLALRGNSIATEPDQEVVGAGAVANLSGALSLISTVVEENENRRRSVVGAGGVLTNTGPALLIDTVVRDNRMLAGGVSVAGGILSNVHALTAVASTVAGNDVAVAVGDEPVVAAGGIFANSGSTTTILGSTISGNSVAAIPGETGGLHANGSAGLLLRHVTLVGNSGPGTGNLRAAADTPVVGASIVAGGSGNEPNCFDPVVSAGGNVEDADSCGFSAAAGDLTDTDPLLGPLADNGGQTPTHALLAGSPAIGLVPPGDCAEYDQRGVRRPQGGSCDAGAFEYVAPPPPPPIPPAPTPAPPPAPPQPPSGAPKGDARPACVVPKLRGKRLRRAKRLLRARRCRPGKVVRRPARARRGRVLATRPKPGARRKHGARVRLVVSRGRRR